MRPVISRRYRTSVTRDGRETSWRIIGGEHLAFEPGVDALDLKLQQSGHNDDRDAVAFAEYI